MTRKELVDQIFTKKSFLCVGLDVDLNKVPQHLLKEEDPIFAFNKQIIDATAPYCVAYKPNLAFYEAYGVKGLISFEKTVKYIQENYPEQFIIADAKRGDIGNTSKMYAQTFFGEYKVDALTVAPYMGEDSVVPFLSYVDSTSSPTDGKKPWVILLALTSNKGSFDFQQTTDTEGQRLFEKVIKKSQEWGTTDNLMYVVGATRGEMFKDIRKVAPEHFLLVPGVGAQGGSLQEVCKYGIIKDCGLLVNSSRGIIFADNTENFAAVSAQKAKELQEQMEVELTKLQDYMEFTAQQIAELIQGRIEGNPNAKINTFAKIEEGKPGAISFLSNKKYINYIYTTKSSVVLVDESLELEKAVEPTLIRVKSAYEAVAKLLQFYESMKPKKKGISDLAFIDPSATIGKDCYIGPFVAIGPHVTVGDGCVFHPHATIGEGASIGNNTEIYSNAVVYHGCKVGNNCILHAGCVIGADGFGFAPGPNGYDKIPQIGIVTIEDNVEIGANTCVDRSTMGSTFVRHGVKLDNLVQIAHNTDIGANTVMSSQVGIAGSTKVGEWCMFGGQVGIAGHIKIGNKVCLGAQSGVPGSLKDGENLIGTPPIPLTNYFRSSAIFKRLPDMYRQINEMQKTIDALQAKLAEK